MPLMLTLDEISSGVCCSPQTIISLHKPLSILLLMVVYGQCSALVQISRLLMRQVELIIDFLAVREQAPLTHILVLLVDVALSFELVHALLTDFLNRAMGCFLFPLLFLLDSFKCLFGLKSRPVEVLLVFSLLALSDIHGYSQLEEALPR